MLQRALGLLDLEMEMEGLQREENCRICQVWKWGGVTIRWVVGLLTRQGKNDWTGHFGPSAKASEASHEPPPTLARSLPTSSSPKPFPVARKRAPGIAAACPS